MSGIDVKDLRRALVEAGLLVFRVKNGEVHLAERQNVQLMEAGVRVLAGDTPAVTVVVRAQRSDSPQKSPEVLLAIVRAQTAPLRDAGYIELEAASREIRSVSDPHQVVDVWHELTLRRPVTTREEAVTQAIFAMGTERYVVPTP